jgi:hypothetical protein
MTHCDNLVKGGYADWRLPTPIELQSLLDYTQSTIGINQNYFPNTVQSAYWSSVLTVNSPGSVWVVGFGSASEIGPNYGLFYARCVRPGSSVKPEDRYRDELGNILSNSSTQVQDLVTGLIWERGFSGVSRSRSDASNYCSSLALGNYGASSWRLPTVKELSTLVDVNLPAPPINTTVFPGSLSLTGDQDYFWTTTDCLEPTLCVPNSYSYLVGLGANRILSTFRGNPYSVKCVRTPVVTNPEWANWDVTTGVYEDQTNQTGRYTNSLSQEVVTDGMTGLQWEKISSSNIYNWTEANAYCDSLVKSGYADWRLPTRVELQSLVDYRIDCAGPGISGAEFPSTPTSYFWSADSLAGYLGNAWWVSFGTGATYSGGICSQGFGGCSNVLATGFARCVRPLLLTSVPERYIFNNSQVIDTVTRLIWQRNAKLTACNWTDAIDYCSSLVLDGINWRLPIVK